MVVVGTDAYSYYISYCERQSNGPEDVHPCPNPQNL